MHQKHPPANVATARRGVGAAARSENAARRRRRRFMIEV